MTKIQQLEQLMNDWRTRARHCALIHAELNKKGDILTAKQALTAKEVYMTCARNLEATLSDVLPSSRSLLGNNWPIF